MRIVGIGGSAGALEAFRDVLRDLPSNTGFAFIFVVHMSPDKPSALAPLLAHWTRMQVVWASDGLELEADRIYIIPPNSDLSVDGDLLRLRSPRTFSGRHHQVDLLFASLADARGSEAIAVIISGVDGDGSHGCRAIRAKGGVVIVQDRSARIDGMPRAAQAVGCSEFVLSPREIAPKLAAFAVGELSNSAND